MSLGTTNDLPPNPIDAARPVLAMINNSLTPYRLALHRRIVRELPGLHLFSLFTHERSNAPWRASPPIDINPVQFGAGEDSDVGIGPASLRREWKKGGEIIQWLKTHRAAAVVLGGYNDPGRLRILSWCHRQGVPCLIFADSNIRGDRAQGVKAFIKRRLLARVIRQAAALLPCGSLGEAYFRKYGASPEKIFYHPYEPDYEQIGAVTVAQSEAALERFHLPPRRRRIVYSGRLVTLKRVDLLLKAFASIAAERADWDLLIIGDGPDRAKLKLIENAFKLTGRVYWTGFIDDQQTLSALYRASEVLVLPSEVEPWGLVINEAAAAGMAIVATSIVGAAAELVKDNVNGRIVPPGQRALLSVALRETTSEEKIGQMRSASLHLLWQWRTLADPVTGLARALRFCGISIPGASAVAAAPTAPRGQ